MEPSDCELIGRYLHGDPEAFTALYSRYECHLLRFLLSLGGSWEQAEEAFQLSWIKAIERLADFQGRGSFRSWLFRIAHRTWLDQVRRGWERRRVSIAGVEDWESLPIDRAFLSSSRDPVAVAEDEERRVLLREALESLPDKMRQTVLLRIDGELTYQQIADEMGCPLSTALWRVREAERRLAAILNPDQAETG